MHKSRKNKKLHRQFNRECWYCGKQLGLKDATRDHIVPVSKGGTSKKANLRLACQPCNVAKGNLSVEEYRAKIMEERGMDWNVEIHRFAGEILKILGREVKYVNRSTNA